jgi:hypothetical protein
MLLTDHYRNVANYELLNSSGWHDNYYGVLEKVINDNGYKAVAEIGIGYGLHAKSILQGTNIDKFYLIDPMCFYENDIFADTIMALKPAVPGNNFNELYGLIQNELSPWADKITWLRKPSLEVTMEDIPDNSLDCVFVDGDHSYKAVIQDLHFWWKKVRIGGKILGDDYWMQQVSRAVHEFSRKKGVRVSFLTKPGTDYKIFCFDKKIE